MTEVWASSPPAKHCRDPGTIDADEALAMSLGLSARGNRTRPLAVKAKYRTSSPRIACPPGNIRDGFTPCGESHALPLSYGRARAPPGGFEPPTLRLPMQPISSPPENWFGPRVARADEGSRWGTGDFGGSPIETRSPSREALATRDAPALAEPIPRHDRTEAGFEPALPLLRSIRNLHHQRIYSGIAGTTMTALSVIASAAKQSISLRDYTPTKFQDPSCSNCLEDLRRERTRRGQIGEWPAAEPWIASLRSQ
jgi:hypothetical protein